MDFTKLTKADRIIGGAGLLFLISTFLSWFEISLGGFGSASGSGWDVGFFWGRFPFFIVLGMLVWIGLRSFSAVKLPPQIPALFLAGGGLTLLLPLLKLLIGEDAPGGIDVSRSFGLFLAVLAGAGVAFGGYLKFIEGGGKIDELKAQMSGMADQLGDKAKSAAADAKNAVDKKD